MQTAFRVPSNRQREYMPVYSTHFYATVQEQYRYITAYSIAGDRQLIKYGRTSLLSLFVASGQSQRVERGGEEAGRILGVT